MGSIALTAIKEHWVMASIKVYPNNYIIKKVVSRFFFLSICRSPPKEKIYLDKEHQIC